MNNTNYKREKDFGIVFIVIFTLLLLYSFFFNDQKYLIIFLVFLFIIATSTFIKPGFLRIPSILWLDFAKIVSKITNPIIFSLIFLAHFIPSLQEAMLRGWEILELASDYFWIIILTIVGGSFGSSSITKFIKRK